MINQYLIFKLNTESYALNIENVREVIEYIEPEKIPNSESHILGILNIRNEVISLMDSRIILNSSSSQDVSKSKIVIFEQDSHHIGIIVDSVSDVLDIDDSEIGETSHLKHQDNSDSYVKGLVTRENKLIIIIDPLKTKLNIIEEVA
jgi:purine-binding chemotaxis protein CheW